MFTYTLNGETYYVSGGKIYVTVDEEHGLEEIDDHPYHLYEYEDRGEYLVRLEWGGSIYTQVKITPIDDEGPPKEYVNVEEFDSATVVESLVPDSINECPDCGGWAGDETEEPRCLQCGYGYDDDSSDTSSTAAGSE